MRLAIVVPTFPTRVTSAELWLAQGLAELGHDVVVFSSGREGARKDRGWSSGSSTEPARVNRFRVRELSTVALGYAEAAVPLRVSPIFSEHPDVVLLQEDYPPLSQLVAGAARRRSIPYLITSERYTDLSPWLARTVVRALDRWVLPRVWRNSAGLTLHSMATRRFFLEREVPADRLHYIPASTDVGFFAPGPNRGNAAVDSLWLESANTVRILSAARLYPAKGLHTFVRAVGAIRGGSGGVTTLVRGRGPLEASLQSEVARLGLSGDFRIDGTPLGPSDLPALYRSADIYVQPSLIEPFGMATLEAMACGLPVVASDTGGLSDLVEEGVNGLLVPPGDSEALARALRSLIADRDLRHRMGRASRVRAETTFAVQPVARSFDELLRAARA